jgi:hypothetical protein
MSSRRRREKSRTLTTRRRDHSAGKNFGLDSDCLRSFSSQEFLLTLIRQLSVEHAQFHLIPQSHMARKGILSSKKWKWGTLRESILWFTSPWKVRYRKCYKRLKTDVRKGNKSFKDPASCTRKRRIKGMPEPSPLLIGPEESHSFKQGCYDLRLEIDWKI